MEQTQHMQTNTHTFCHSRLRNTSLTLNTRKVQADKSPYKQLRPISIKFLHKLPSNYIEVITNQKIRTQTINVITRNRKQIETSIRPILKRFRGPNKMKITSNQGPRW